MGLYLFVILLLSRSFDLTDPEDIFPYIIVTPEIDATDGNPKFSSIDALAIEICDDLKVKYGLAEPT